MTSNTNTGEPVEVWVTRDDGGMTYGYAVVHADESMSEWRLNAHSIQSAQRETTAILIDKGYRPEGRWTETADHEGEAIEVMRRFRQAADHEGGVSEATRRFGQAGT